MAQQLLDLANVGAAFQQMRGARVTQRVRRDVLAEACALGRLTHNAHDIVVIQWTTGTARGLPPKKRMLSGHYSKA